jgi:lipoprotein-anchoring transpeptidase ErfK/SrfK
MIEISIAQQVLCFQGKKYIISTAKNGVGTVAGSFCTPAGNFEIAKKIGAGLPINSVFVARQPTQEIYSDELAKNHPRSDWILSRILWLSGLDEDNKNTYERYIYIHGTQDEKNLGIANSKGCIRMKNLDIIEIFDKINTGDKVIIR